MRRTSQTHAMEIQKMKLNNETYKKIQEIGNIYRYGNLPMEPNPSADLWKFGNIYPYGNLPMEPNEGKEITFNKRNSFSSRIEASRQSECESARRSFSVRTQSILVGLSRSESHNQFSSINLQGLDTTSSIPRTTYNQEPEDDQNSIQSPTYFSIHEPYDGLKRQQIQDKFYKFVERVKTNIPFFDWFHAYTIKENIDYPWQHDIICDPTTNVITNWQIKDYQLPKVKDSSDKPVMATLFKTKDVNEEITPKDIRSLMEQTNYTDKYLQVLGESISKEKVFTKPKDHGLPSLAVQMEKPLFKPFKKFTKLLKQKSPTKEIGDNNSELLRKINSLLKTVPETPQSSEESSKIRTRHTSELINAINKDTDNNSEQVSEEGSVSEKVINPINTKHWKTPSKLYYQRPTAPDLLLEERGETTAYQTSHECPEETIVDILVAGFSGQLKGWWDNYLTNDGKSKIYSAIKMDLNGKVITNDDNEEIPDAVNTLIFTIAKHFIGDPSLWKDRSAELLSNLKCGTLVADFRWYRDTFLTRVYTREDSQHSFWKEKFLSGLPRSLGDKVGDKICSQSTNEDIPYDSVSYGQLISYIQKDDKIQRQLAKEKAQNKRDLGSFCEQFGLSACPKQKKKQNPKTKFQKKYAPKRRFSNKPQPIKKSMFQNPKPKTKVVCYNCGKQGHISKYCRLKKKLRNLSLDPSIEE
ncbi:putative Polyprotein CP [Glycine max]|nr:putative Polyprotein CP [Glycine max]